MYLYIYICINIYIYIYMYVCMYIYMYMCIYIYVYYILYIGGFLNRATPKSSIQLLGSIDASPGAAPWGVHPVLVKQKGPGTRSSAYHVCIYHVYNNDYIIYIYSYDCIYIDIHTYVRTYVRTYVHPSIHPYIHTYIHTYIHKYMHIFSLYNQP